jgi:hypothetical protein
MQYGHYQQVKKMDFEERHRRFREQLLYEFLNPKPIKKNPNKSSVSLCKREKFLKKKGNKPEPGDKITYMPAMKKAPKVKPDFIPLKKKQSV